MASSEVVPETPDGSVSSSTLHKEGPVLCFINKRLRGLRKKYNRILQIEENKSKGKVVNREQEDVLRSKISVATLIQEFEKLKQPLSNAVKEELAERERELMRQDGDSSSANDKENSSANGETIENEELDRKAVLPNGCYEANRENSEEGFIKNENASDSDVIEDLLKFMYFAQLFDVCSHEKFASMMWTKMHERMSCLSYDYVTEDATDHLKEEDLDALATLGSLLTSRSSNATISHSDALQDCLHHARQWLCNSDQPIHPDVLLSYSGLRERLNRITSSEYFVMAPELKTFSQQTAAAAVPDVAQYVPPLFVLPSSSEDGVLQMEGAPIYFQHQNLIETEQQLYQDESSSPVGTSELSNTVGDGISSFQFVAESNGPSEILQNEVNQIPTSPIYELKEDETQYEHLHSLPQLSQQYEQQDEQQLSQQQHSGQQPQQMQPSQQQQQQYYAQNGGLLRSNRGGQNMGYGGGGRGRGYMNGRGNRRGRIGSYSDGYGQYYDQGTQSPRNYYSRKGRGGRDTMQANGIQE